MDDIVTAVAVLILAAVFSALIKSRSREMSLLLVISAAVTVTLLAAVKISPVITEIESYAAASGFGAEYFEIVLKAAGVTIAASTARGVCKDAGENSLCTAIDLAEKACVLIIALPVIGKIFGFLAELLQF